MKIGDRNFLLAVSTEKNIERNFLAVFSREDKKRKFIKATMRQKTWKNSYSGENSLSVPKFAREENSWHVNTPFDSMSFGDSYRNRFFYTTIVSFARNYWLHHASFSMLISFTLYTNEQLLSSREHTHLLISIRLHRWRLIDMREMHVVGCNM